MMCKCGHPKTLHRNDNEGRCGVGGCLAGDGRQQKYSIKFVRCGCNEYRPQETGMVV